ncbi:MAG: sulfatase-like hydrolase/transferase [Acidobacteriota bacterium]
MPSLSALALTGALALCGVVLTGCGTEPPPPSVIVISVDTLRADRLPAYGYGEIETPHLDALRQEALLFENAYTSVPLTLPAHATLFTGRLPPDHGVRDNLGYPLDGEVHRTLAQHLSDGGYRTAGFVSSYVLHRRTGIAAGFEHYDDAIEARDDLPAVRLERAGGDTIQRALDWLDGPATEHSGEGAKGDESPFFLFLHLFEPHDPYEAPEPWGSSGADSYDGEVAYTDHLLGAFFEGLKERGLWESSVVIFASDHGEGLGDHGEAKHGLLLYREAMRVPLLLKAPGGEQGGATVATPVHLMDVLPTVLESTALPVPTDLGLEGLAAPRSLWQSASLEAEGGGEELHRDLYGETYYGRLHYGWSELRTLVDERFRFIESPNPELYDLVADPGELENVLRGERRAYFEMRDQLAAVPDGFEAPQAVDPEQAAQLAALGYLSAPVSSSDGPRPDPKENLHILDAIQQGVDLRAAGRHEEAVEVLQDLLADHPEIQDAYLMLVPSLRALGRLDEALTVALESRRVLPSLAPLVAMEMARLRLQRGELDEAAAEAQAALPSHPAQGWELLARVEMARGDLVAAREAVDEALETGDRPRFTALLLGGHLAMLGNDLPTAVERLDLARERVDAGSVPPHPQLNLMRGDALARLGRYEEAEAAFQAQIQAFPRQPLAYRNLAFLYAAQGRQDAIEPLLGELVRIEPTPQAIAFAAETLERLGDSEAAARWRQR